MIEKIDVTFRGVGFTVEADYPKMISGTDINYEPDIYLYDQLMPNFIIESNARYAIIDWAIDKWEKIRKEA